MHKRKFNLYKKIEKITKHKVVNGYYKSLILSKNYNWNKDDVDLSPKLLGCYEEQVQEKIIELKKKNNLKYLVVFGASEGFHALGLMKNKFFNKAYIFEKDNKKGLINPNGEVLIPATYDQISINDNSNIAQIWRDNNMGYYNISLNTEIVPTQFDYTNYHGLGGEYPQVGDKDKISVISSKSGRELMGFYDKSGIKICDPIYDPIDYPAFINNLCAVSLYGKYGLIDDHNRMIIPFEYDYIRYPVGHKVIVTQGVKQAIFDVTK
jgi:hypothetical protein